MGAQGAESKGPVDAKALVAFAEGDWALARGLVKSFADTTDQQLIIIAEAMESGDFPSLREAAHAIKGASAILFATAAAVEAGRLEDAAKSGNLAEVERCAERVRTEVANAAEYFRAWMELNEP